MKASAQMTEYKKDSDSVFQKILGDTSGSFITLLAVLGIRLGLFHSLKEKPLHIKEFSEKNSINPIYAKEWLDGMSLSSYIQYDEQLDKYYLLPEQEEILLDKDSPIYWEGMINMWQELALRMEHICTIFQNGEQLDAKFLTENFYQGTTQFSEPLIHNQLLTQWLPQIPGITAILEQGGSIADVGCGFGAASIAIANHYEKSRIKAIDIVAYNIRQAEKRSACFGIESRVDFVHANAAERFGESFDLILLLDVLTATSTPLDILKSCATALKPGGYCLCLVPKCKEDINEDSIAVGKILYGFSCFHETPITSGKTYDSFGTLSWSFKRLNSVFQEYGCKEVVKLKINSDFYNLFLIRK